MSKVAPSEVEEANQQVVEKKEPETESSEKEWGNPIEFLMTLLSFAVGLGNVWRFPYLCFKNGGSAFIIAMVIMLFGAGLPLFFLEISIAQFSKFSTIDVWKIVPPLRGLGYVSLLIPTGIIIYYNILIAYSLIYAISSFLPDLPWATCNFAWNDARCCSYAKVEGSNETIVCGLDTESPARQYFYNYVLEFSEGIEYFDAVNWKLAIALFACWLLVFLSLSKGVQSLGKVSYFTAIFPYIMIFVLIVRGATLDGASLGIKYYVGTINWEKLGSLECWTDASSQVYFILGVGQGGLYTLGKHNKFNYNHKRAAVFIAILDGLTGILAGFAIFSVLGYMSKQTGIPVPELAVGGPGLSFIVYSEALSLMPLPQLWCVLFFLMMITIGFGSSLSLCECVLNSLAERFSKKINTKTKNTLFRFGICMIFFCIAFPMSTRAGLYIQNLIDEYLSGYPFYLFAFFEALGLCWLYGIKRIREDVYLMLKTRPGIYWTITFAIVPVLTFAVLIIFTIKLAQNPLVYLNDYVYPPGAQAIGWIIVAVVVAPLPIFFILHLIEKKPKLTKESLQEFIEPHPDWKPALPAGYNTESDELVVQSHDASLEMEKINEKSNQESEFDKDRRLSQTVLE